MKVAPNTAKILRNVPLPDEVGVIHNNAAVMDMGSHSTRLGFAGDSAPRMRQRTVAMTKAGEGAGEGKSAAAAAASTAALPCFDSAYDQLDHTHVMDVMRNGNVVDWAAYEQLMQRVDDILQLSSPEMNTPLLVTEKALVPTAHRQKMSEILFEKHNLTSVSFALSPVLALYASGLCTGVSVELGHDQCHVVPVFQGLGLFHATHCLSLGGRRLTELFAEHSGNALPPSVLPHRRGDLWAYLKEKLCVTQSGREACAAALEDTNRDRHALEHRLPDGTVLHITPESRFLPAETFFRPTLLPQMREYEDQSHIVSEVQLRTTATSQGLHNLLVDAVRKCDADLTAYMLDNILLSGGSSLFAGLPDRLEAEVQALLPPSADRVRVSAEVERQEAAFVGGSIIASMPAFQEAWVTKTEYEEVGAMAVVRGCL